MRRLAFIAALIWCLSPTSCGGGGNGGTAPPPPPVISITISPTSATLQVGATQQFTATVTGTTNTAVSWLLSSPTAPAGTDLGSISSSGLYTAPLSVSAQLTVNVMATSAANPNKSAEAIVTVTAPTKPVLLWEKNDFQSDFNGVTTDQNGNMILGGAHFSSTGPNQDLAEVGIAASYNANGTLRWNFDMGQEQSLLFNGIALQDGSSFWAGNTGLFSNVMPMLLGLTNNGQKLLENTCPGSNTTFRPIAEAGGVIYLGGLTPPAIVTADANSGYIDCANTLVVKNDSSASITSVRTNGTYLLATGTFYSKPPGSNLDHATYVVKINLATKQVVWEKDFQDVIIPHVLATTENGQDVVYVSGVLAYPNGTTDMYTITDKLDVNGNQQVGWPQTYPNPLPAVYGNGAIVQNPLGGVITVGGNCTFTAYKPDGTTRWDFQQNFTSADACNDATVFNGEFLYVAGGVNITSTNFVNEKTLAASFALPQQ